MSFFSQASLVMIPSGYKTSKVYSVVPTSGDGDLVFSRSNDTATRVASNGLIEKVRTNLLTYSEDFTNGAWFKTAVTITADATTAPNGTTTADKIIATATSGNHFASRSAAVLTGEFTFSVFAKAAEYSFLKLQDVNAGVFNCTFDLSAGTASGTGAAIQSVGSGWFRCSVTYTSSGSSVANALAGAPSTSISYTGDGTSGIFVWGAQLETGVMTDYIATTTAAVSVGPVANVPRLDYLGSTCPRLLLEPQRSNLLTFSEQINNAAWLNAGGTTTANTAVSPSGYQDADTLTGVRYQASFASNTYTLSAFAKKVDGDNTFVLRFDAPTTKVAVFNLNNGTIVSTDAGYTSTITAYGNGWYRCTFTSPASTTISNAVLVSASAGVSSTFVYGCQLEVGAYATSYIPTLGAAVTRGADIASKTGISSLMPSTEGTVFIDAEIDFNKSNFTILGSTYVNGGTMFSHSVYFYINNNKIDGQIWWTPAFTGWTGLSSTLTNGRHKLAIAWKANDFAYYIDGALVASSTAYSSVPTGMNRLDVGDYYASYGTTNSYNQMLIFKTRLTNAQLAELTTI